MIHISPETAAFITAHRNDDVKTLALKYQGIKDIDLTFALEQIDGRQRALEKIPLWAEHEGIVFPKHISLEQCSNEKTAEYKRNLLVRLCYGISSSSHGDGMLDIDNHVTSDMRGKALASMADLTGGFGVDLSYMSMACGAATYVERQEYLCDIARHNFHILGRENISVCHDTTEHFLETTQETYGVIYLDPARRDVNGMKTYAISDCSPDVVSLLPSLKSHARWIIIKLSPMLDHREACRQLPGVCEVHILSVKNECKETLLVIAGDAEVDKLVDDGMSERVHETKVFCTNDDEVFVTPLVSDAPLPEYAMPAEGMTLCVPNASIMKAGCFGDLCCSFALRGIEKNSHLFLTEGVPPRPFPCRTFRIKAICSLNRKELRRCLSGITHANVAVRNFPLSAAQLKKRLNSETGLKDGGETYIFATTVGKRHILLITEKD